MPKRWVYVVYVYASDYSPNLSTSSLCTVRYSVVNINYQNVANSYGNVGQNDARYGRKEVTQVV